MTLLRIRGIVKRYGTKLNPTIALDGVSFNVGKALNESRRNKIGLSSRTSTCSTPTRRMLMDRFAYLN